MNASKEEVQRYWELHPCGVSDERATVKTLEFFRSTESVRACRDAFMDDLVQFDLWRGMSVLEIGCGIGVDTARFARAGADVWAMDLTRSGVITTRARLDAEGLRGMVCSADAESLPFPDRTFDLVYSWGVVHHTTRSEVAASEMVRVCRPGGKVLAMVYSRRSLVAVQAWLRYGLLEGRPLRSPRQLIRDRLESPGTRAFTRREALRLFPSLSDASVRGVVTAWDLRVGRRRFLPGWMRSLVPSRLGWFLVVSGTRT